MFLICLRHSRVSLQDRNAKESHMVMCHEGVLEPGPQLSSIRGYYLLSAWTYIIIVTNITDCVRFPLSMKPTILILHFPLSLSSSVLQKRQFKSSN